jgi:hypothetical protein
MNFTTSTWGILAGILIVAVIALAAWLVYRQRRQSRRLKERFGAEYGRTVDDLGSRTKAESDLKARELRVARFTIVPLTASEADRMTLAWTTLQGRFVDSPKGVLVEADQLVRELMLKLGYPMADFDRRAQDISVDHPSVVEHYRTAQATALRDRRGEADTEELRQGIVHYRALFEELLASGEPKPVPARQVAAVV